MDKDEYLRCFMGCSKEQFEKFRQEKPEFQPLLDLCKQLILRNRDLELQLHTPSIFDLTKEDKK